MGIMYFVVNVFTAGLCLNAFLVIKAKKNEGIRKVYEVPVMVAVVKTWFGKAGCRDTGEMVFYTVVPIIGVVLALVAFASGEVARGIIVLVMPVMISALLLAAKKNKNAVVFQKNSYKLYKYILNQVSAGVRPGDAIKSMYEVVEEKQLRKLLMKACAKYSVSMDNNVIAQGILDNIDTPEARSFAMSLRDGIFESRDDKLMQRLEQLMFNRYFAYIQRETDSVKTRCLITVVLLCSVIVIMILVPTFMDVQNALNSIFSQ